MRFQTPLVPARLLRRYKRFLADALLEDGREVTVHCPNPGAMLGLDAPGARIWLEPVSGRGRKLPFSWKLVELEGGHLAGIDTAMPNRVVGEALAAGAIPGLEAEAFRAEVPIAPGSRTDFRLTLACGTPLWLEVKNVHLRRESDWAEFPDCVTVRGARHLAVLSERAAAGERAVMLYLVQRTDCARFRLADDLDPAYARAFDAARIAGVEMRAFASTITQEGVWLAEELPVDPHTRSVA